MWMHLHMFSDMMCRTGDEDKAVHTREVGILQYLGLDDWKVALPVAMCFAPPLIHHEVGATYLYCIEWYFFLCLLCVSKERVWAGMQIRMCRRTYIRLSLLFCQAVVIAWRNESVRVLILLTTHSSPLQVIIVDYKFYLVGAFCVMWHAYDAVIMPIWAENTDWIQEDITNFWKKVDAQAIEEIDSSIKSNEDFVVSKELFQDMFNAVDAVSETRAVAMNKATANDYHRAVQKKLDALVSLNEATSAAIRTDMIDSVKAEVTKNLSSSSVKDNALSQAIANLAAGAKSPRGKDVVGEEYSKAIASYKAGLASKDHRVHNITAKLETEIAEICKPIEVPQTAGNVYETHPVL